MSGAPAQAGGGPVQPEAAQFEPVDATDMVSLATGDFSYVLPLFEVPGPNGGYPLSLSYHAGIGPNQEATWVGLGWSLNPGAITRGVIGYPDDYNGDITESRFYGEASGWGISVGAGYGPYGMNMTFDSHEGLTGVNATIGLAPLGIPGAAVSVGTDGVGITAGGEGGRVGIHIQGKGKARLSYAHELGLRLSSRFGGGSTSIDLGFREVASVGYTLSSHGNHLSYGLAGGSISGMTSAIGRSSFNASGYTIPIPLPHGFWASLGVSTWSWSLNDVELEHSYGYLYASNYDEGDGSDGDRFDMVANQGAYDAVLPAQDLYQVSAQGIGGHFSALHQWGMQLQNLYEPEDQGRLVRWVDEEDDYSLENVVFRLANDPGANFATRPMQSGSEWNQSYSEDLNMISSPASTNMTSQPIEAQFNSSGALKGFRVTKQDGTVYEFMKPVYNKMNIASTKTIIPGADEEDRKWAHTTVMGEEYATSWLITSIKGPDYINRPPLAQGVPDENDWGYWVRFRYATDGGKRLWRSPVVGFGPRTTPKPSLSNPEESRDDTETDHYTLGVREYTYLKSVESSTHVAVFNTSAMENRAPYWSAWDTLYSVNLRQEDALFNNSITVRKNDLVESIINSDIDGDNIFAIKYSTSSGSIYHIVPEICNGSNFGSQTGCVSFDDNNDGSYTIELDLEPTVSRAILSIDFRAPPDMPDDLTSPRKTSPV